MADERHSNHGCQKKKKKKKKKNAYGRIYLGDDISS